MSEEDVAAPHWVSHDESTSFDSQSLKGVDTLLSLKTEHRDVGETLGSQATSEFQNGLLEPSIMEEDEPLKIS